VPVSDGQRGLGQDLVQVDGNDLARSVGLVAHEMDGWMRREEIRGGKEEEGREDVESNQSVRRSIDQAEQEKERKEGSREGRRKDVLVA